MIQLYTHITVMYIYTGFPDGAVVKSLCANTGDVRDLGSIPGSRRSPGEGNGNQIQYSCLENSLDRGAWWATVYGVSKYQTWLSKHAYAHTHTHTDIVVQSLSNVWFFATPWTAALQDFLSFTISWSLLKLMSTIKDAIQPSHSVSSPSPSALHHSQHQGLFQWVSSSHQVFKVLELQHQPFQWIFRTDFL